MVDDPEESDFILPAVMNRGRLTLTVSTSGASPTLTKKIKEDLAQQYGPEYQEYVDFLYQCRKWILDEVEDAQNETTIINKNYRATIFNDRKQKRSIHEVSSSTNRRKVKRLP